jgi:hypothetical protein
MAWRLGHVINLVPRMAVSQVHRPRGLAQP